ncbi:sodium:solute symporter [Aliifodinibius salicampi]|uniref:Sodium:solute symporter n=1 Tax=Fodinibius salicampi TaxID=1920655 RepID=A0ABT3PU35_9BACT|nr:sodium:solute symporter [Fodinibius salicampi]MCW9711338.1 sodium:solute symporter [Fodinibius salicampi]
MGTLAVIDWVVIGLYFLLIAGLAWWVIKQKTDTTTDYFLAGRHLGWIIVGTSIFASNIGSEHLVGLTGTGATDGVAMAHYELHAWCLLILGWVMLPFYIRSRVFTMPEFLEKRFSPLARTLLSGVSLLAYVLTKIAVGIFAGGIVFSVLIPELSFMGMNSFWIGSILVILFTGLYTVLGGLRAVAYTEAVQTLVLIFGSVMVLYYGLDAIGGWNRLYEVAGPEMFDLWKPIVPDGYSATWAPIMGDGEMAWYFNSNYPWLGMLFAAPIVGLWYWTTDQYIVQRALGAPNEKEGRRGTIAAAFLKLLPVFLFIIPGIIAFALAKSGEVQILQEQLMNQQGEIINENAQASFPLLVAHILPIGIRGIVVAGLLAALMSSLAGVFNASSTLFTMDFYSKFKPDASEQHLVWMGRLATVVMVIIGLLWIPVIQGSRGLYDYLQGVQAYLAPPIFVVFFFGIFFKRLNKQGALSALIIGLFLGVFRLAIDTPVMLGDGFTYAEGSFFWIVNNIFFQYYSLLIFLVCIAVMFGVSYMTDPPKYEKISGLTYGTLTDEDKRMSRESWNWVDVSLSVLLVAVIGFIYIYFS